MLTYDLGMMRSPDGSSLRYEVERKSSDLAIKISEAIVSERAYEEISGRLPSRRVRSYFQYLLKKEVYPYVRQACVIDWYRRNSKVVSPENRPVKVPAGGIFPLLIQCWDFNDIKIIPEIKVRSVYKSLPIIGKRIKDMLSRKNRAHNFSMTLRKPDGYMIACHYAEGIDPLKRNDLNWYDGSGIDPKKVLVYFDTPNNSDGNPVRKEEVDKLRKAGFTTVVLKEGIVEGGENILWPGPANCRDSAVDIRSASNSVERWIYAAGNDIIGAVKYWRAFHDEFNVRINYIPEEGAIKNHAQAIAFDMDGERGGLLAGKQRSEAYLPYRYHLGYHPKHLFFMWNSRAAGQLGCGTETIDDVVLTGYTYDALKRLRFDGEGLLSKDMRTRGAKTVIALFDNMHGCDYFVSTNDMVRFYKAFFEWAIADDKIGLIIKSKKPMVIERLSRIRTLMAKATDTGRCIKMDDEWGRYPSDASFGADFAVGTGISSAVMESVISGCRGIHYDASHLIGHEFYKWGHNRIIFDDLDKMVSALKGYAFDPGSEEGLGDWSNHLNEIDSFRDWKGGERMGQYMRILLESFDKGMTRREALDNADRFYGDKWGQDKVIRTGQTNG
jgi:hypothetical protein